MPSLNEQLDKWDLLFPVEQRTLQNQFDYLAGLSPGDFDGLFRPVKDVEAKMQLPRWEASSRRISISETSLLVRSPYYPQWRSEVEKVFAKIDAGVEAGQGPETAPERSRLRVAGRTAPPRRNALAPSRAGRPDACAAHAVPAMARSNSCWRWRATRTPPRTRRNAPGSSKRETL